MIMKDSGLPCKALVTDAIDLRFWAWLREEYSRVAGLFYAKTVSVLRRYNGVESVSEIALFAIGNDTSGGPRYAWECCTTDHSTLL